jgi:large subunit ribosomal protein L30
MAKIRITQKRSTIGHPPAQRATIRCLGLGKIGKTVEKEANPAILGMVRAVSHLVCVSEVK